MSVSRCFYCKYLVSFRCIFTLLVLSSLMLVPVELNAANPSSAPAKERVAPPFSLPSASGGVVSLDSFKGKNVVLEWFNPGCPFVKKHYDSGHMQQLQAEARKTGFVWLSINSTDADHRDFKTAEQLSAIAQDWGYAGNHILLDPSGEVGKRFGAKTTPHMFVINTEGRIVYSGAIDDSPDTSSDPKSSKNFIREVTNEIAAGKAIDVGETEPYGCSVKYAS